MHDIKQQQRYVVLDGMRGIAAIAVMIYHYTLYTSFVNAPMAVDMFFILSGFVITHSYGEKLARGYMTFSGFMMRRIIRLYPLFFAGLVLGGISFVAMGKIGHNSYSGHEIATFSLYNMFFLPYLNDGKTFLAPAITSLGTVFPADTPLWSLFFEMFVNMFCLLLFRLGNETLRKLVIAAFISIVASNLLLGFSRYELNFGAPGGYATYHFLSGFSRVFYGFILGVLLYRLLQDPDIQSRVKHYAGFVRTQPFLLYLGLLGVFSLTTGFYGIFYIISIGLAAPLLVTVGSVSVCRGKITRILSEFLGWISYPVYCLHEPIGRGVDFLFEKHYLTLQIPPIAISVVATLVISVVLTRFYEEPVRRYLTHKIFRKPPVKDMVTNENEFEDNALVQAPAT